MSMKTAQEAQRGDRVWWVKPETGKLNDFTIIEFSRESIPLIYVRGSSVFLRPEDFGTRWGYLADNETVIRGQILRNPKPNLWYVGVGSYWADSILENHKGFDDWCKTLDLSDADKAAIQEHVRKHSAADSPRQDMTAKQPETPSGILIAVNAAGAELWICKDGESYSYHLAGKTQKEHNKDSVLNNIILTGMYRLLSDAWMQKIAPKRRRYTPERLSLLSKTYFLKYPDADATGFHQALSFYRAFVDGFDDMGIKEQGEKMTCHPKEALMAMSGAATAHFSTLSQPKQPKSNHKRTAKDAKAGDEVWLFNTYGDKITGRITDVIDGHSVIILSKDIDRARDFTEFGKQWGFLGDRLQVQESKPNNTPQSPAISAFESAIQEHIESQPKQPAPKQPNPNFNNVKLLIKTKGTEWVKTNAPDAWRAYVAAQMQEVRQEGDKLAKPGILAGKTASPWG